VTLAILVSSRKYRR